jgi:hypothetical protein
MKYNELTKSRGIRNVGSQGEAKIILGLAILRARFT